MGRPSDDHRSPRTKSTVVRICPRHHTRTNTNTAFYYWRRYTYQHQSKWFLLDSWRCYSHFYLLDVQRVGTSRGNPTIKIAEFSSAIFIIITNRYSFAKSKTPSFTTSFTRTPLFIFFERIASAIGARILSSITRRKGLAPNDGS